MAHKIKNPEITTMKVADLTPAPYNPRQITREALDGLKASLTRFGIVEPIIWNKRTGYVVGGHQRLKVLQEEGIEETLAVVVDLGDTEEKALNATLNNPEIQGKFTDSLAGMLESLKPKLPSFQEIRLGDLLEKVRPRVECPKDDAVPEKRSENVGNVGDVWHLGPHRVMCGDCTKEENWAKLMAGKKAACVFTDPPYGVSYESQSGKFDQIKGDEKRDDDLANTLLLPSLKMLAKHTRDEAGFYIWHDETTRKDFELAMTKAGLVELARLLWVKPSGGLGMNDYRKAHEPCFYAGKAGFRPHFYGDRTNTTIWRATLARGQGGATVLGQGVMLMDGQGGTLFLAAQPPKGRKTRRIRVEPGQPMEIENSTGQHTTWEVTRDGNMEHPTQKPTELARRAILNSSKPGQIVLDAFLGSGTTLIGAEQTDRICYGMELDPGYVDVIVRRWEALTGKKATRGGA